MSTIHQLWLDTIPAALREIEARAKSGTFLDSYLPKAKRTTREKGRHYPRSEVCPVCFKAFTPKGAARHTRACRRKETLTKALLGA